MERCAHTSEDARKQTMEEHLEGTAALAQNFAERIGFGQFGRLIGILHDLGKYSDTFQSYITGAALNGRADNSAEESETPNVGTPSKKIDHSTAGAQFVWQSIGGGTDTWKNVAAKILALIIAGHHGGLPDCLSSDGEDLFIKRMNKEDAKTHLSEALAYAKDDILNEAGKILSDERLYDRQKAFLRNIEKSESAAGKENMRDRCDFALGMFVKMLYSCLVDADRCDTADFCTKDSASIRQNSSYTDWETLEARLNAHLNRFDSSRPLARIRRDISDWSRAAAAKPRGIFTMTVPTGGGKTLAALRFGLTHAKLSAHDAHPIERIIYVIPYTTIIEQNAERVREILETDDERGRIALECHSNLLEEKDTRENQILSENWDAPIIFTTNVQFLEAIFSNSPNKLRRMHRLANSIIIFDEIQTLPIKTIHLFCSAINFLVRKCGTTVLLCTATQPLLNGVKKQFGALDYGREAEIVPSPETLFHSLKRVKIYSRIKAGGYSIKEMAELALAKQREFGSLLEIVNTTSVARELYEELAKGANGVKVFHMSARMCPAHRMDVLKEMSASLASREPLICVATSVMEAGVDADFACVIRSVAGFDSIVQAAGRCNREGLWEMGCVYIVNPSDEKLGKLEDVREGCTQAERVIKERVKQNGEEDLLSLENIESYFIYYFYARENEMRYWVKGEREDNLLNMLSSNRFAGGNTKIIRQAFASAGKLFKAIEAPTESVIIPYGAGRQIIEEINGCKDLAKLKKLLRRAQRYSVNIYPYQTETLLSNGGIVKIIVGGSSCIWALTPEFYDDSFGLSTERVREMPLYCI